ncbi:MAG: GGDEF domain-containing protein, partial [Planctomycetales bacterium]|nr:GGDEF domain-containing protein [Planctomycetales bacterium]
MRRASRPEKQGYNLFSWDYLHAGDQCAVTETLLYIAPWVLGSVCIGLTVGFFLGRNSRPAADASPTTSDASTKILLEVLGEMERISGDVHERNSEIEQTARDVDDLVVTPEMDQVKSAVLGHVTKLLTSNRKLEDDLLYTQYRVQEQAQEIDVVRREARTDELTGVANRKAFDEKLHVLLGRWRREETPFSLVLVDLDHFKRINDSHGHPAGDFVLERVGCVLRECVRDGDFIARLGGDEFAVLLPHTDL